MAALDSHPLALPACHLAKVVSVADPQNLARVQVRLLTVDGDGAPITFPYVVSPLLHPDTGEDVDRVSDGFLGTFPRARQTVAGVRFGTTNLRGVWDRSRLLHHGAARSLREVLATPGHAALRPGERGLNERFGQPDTHGATSTLSVDELLALERFLEGL